MKNPMKTSIKTITLASTLVIAIAGCSSDSDYNFESSEKRQQQLAGATVGAYDPANGVFPLPNDLLFTGTADGTLNIPVEDETDYGNPRVALNTLDGFSTIEPIVAAFNATYAGDFSSAGDELSVQQIDASTVKIQETVRLFEVTRGSQLEVTGIVAEVDASQVKAQVIPADPTSSPNGSQIALIPVQPLKEQTTYMALITSGVKDVTGVGLARGITYAALAGPNNLEGDSAALQGLIRLMLGAGESAGVNPDSVVMSWTFTTQSTTSVLNGLKSRAVQSPISVVDTMLDTGALSPASPDLAHIYVGSMSVPYYLDVPSESNEEAPLNSFFVNASDSFLSPLDNTPVSKNTLTIPVLLTMPKIEAPEGGFPIAIFQHGITRSRLDMLAVADSLASVGFATIAIDIPMHGISPNDPVGAGFRQEGLPERTFDVDYVNNSTGAPASDGIPDASGTHFYNLGNLLNTRDNTRQAVADLFTLSASVGGIEGINAAKKVYIGHSLGAIVGTTFLAFDDTIDSATLAVGGGGLPRILANSPAFGPRIAAGLAAQGLDINSADGNAFLNAAQTAVDSIDPINHAAAAGANTTVHMVQINGDTVVINNLQGFPLVGTEPLARIMGLPQVSSTSIGKGFVKFSTGYHGSLLSPADSNPDDDRDAGQALETFRELQSQIAAFAKLGDIVISNPTVIEQPTEQ